MNKKNTSLGTVLVTGGGKRIGKAIAIDLASQGYSIALHHHTSHTEAQKVQSQIKAFGVQCEIFSCDLSDEFQTSRLMKHVHRKFPKLNLLINSASIFEKSSLLKGNLELFNRHLAVNLKAPLILSRDFARICQKGQIINILDTNVVKNKTSHAAYLLTKKALLELTYMSAVELAPRIRVNGIAPGLILPPVNEKNNYLDRLAKNIPLQKKGDPKYIAQSVRFLIDNSYLTGQIIYVDGGEHLT